MKYATIGRLDVKKFQLTPNSRVGVQIIYVETVYLPLFSMCQLKLFSFYFTSEWIKLKMTKTDNQANFRLLFLESVEM